MPPARSRLALRVAELVGESLVITDLQDGWPTLATLTTPLAGPVPIALYVSTVGVSTRGRDAAERRFQNPGTNRPIVNVPGRELVLVGLWSEDPHVPVPRPLLVNPDAHVRVGRMTRYSVFARVATLAAASATGWAEDVSNTNETVRCFFPELLPVAFDARDEHVAADDVRAVIAAAGLDEEEGPAPAERARRTVAALVRDERFGRSVTSAYSGLCAVCDLDLGLVEGAHIYPASAPGAQDEAWNGLSLCANHHTAFDRHLVHFHPHTRAISFHPNVMEQAQARPAASALIDTRPTLADPQNAADRPKAEMFELRYGWFAGRYEWAS